MPNFFIVMWYICYCYTFAGHSLGALMHLKTKTLQNVHISSSIQHACKYGKYGGLQNMKLIRSHRNWPLPRAVKLHSRKSTDYWINIRDCRLEALVVAGLK